MSLARAVERLTALRRPDGGFAPSPGADSEPEPTAMAAIALEDADAVAWLAASQRDDGGLLVGPEELRNDGATPLAAIALEGAARDRAVDYVIGHRVQPTGRDERFPHDPGTRGWGWTSKTFGWVEPTARAVLALKLLRPDAAGEIEDGLAVLADRECSAGGWNYGNREVLGRDLEPFLQTTAAGLLAVHDGPAVLRDRAIDVIGRLWSDEPGGLGWSQAVVGLRLSGVEATARVSDLADLVARTDLLDDGVSLAWAVLALGDGWERLQVRGR